MRRVYINAVAIALLAITVIFLPHPLFGGNYKYYSRGKRDPFIPLVTGEIRTSLGLESVEAIEDVRFEGVIFDPSGKSIAVLNGEIIKEGDKSHNVEIVKIYHNAITIKIYNRSHTINLVEEGGEAVER